MTKALYQKDGSLEPTLLILMNGERYAEKDKLAEEILEGRLTLPVNVQILSQILTPYP